MWETIKNDPLLKSVTIIVLGVLAFGFAFNIMFGGGGYSLNNTLGYTVSVLIKVVLVIAVIGVVFLAVKMVNKYVVEGKKFSYEELKNDPLAKQTAIAVATLIGLSIISSMFYGTSGTGMTNGMAGEGEMMSGSSMGSSGAMSTSSNLSNGLSTVSILLILIKLLLLISVIGLFIGLVMYLKANYSNKNGSSIFNLGKIVEKTECEKCGYVASANLKFCPECGTSMLVAPCDQCGKEMKAGWKCCPECGNERISTDSIKESM